MINGNNDMNHSENNASGIENGEKQISLAELLPLIEERLSAGQNVKFIPYGTSMLPMLTPGKCSVTLAPPPKRLKKYDVALYRRENGGFVLHRVAKASEDYVFIGDNQFVYEHGIRHSQVIAVLDSYTKDGRELSVDRFAYKLYCRYWHYSRPIRHLYSRAKSYLKRKFCRKNK